MTRYGYVVDASVAIKWFVPEIHSDAAGRLHQSTLRLHSPNFFVLEVGNALIKKFRRGELTQEESGFILKELGRISIQQHSDERLFSPAYSLALQTHRSLYDCLYLALAEVIHGKLVTADRKLYAALANGPYSRRVIWVEDLPELP